MHKCYNEIFKCPLVSSIFKLNNFFMVFSKKKQEKNMLEAHARMVFKFVVYTVQLYNMESQRSKFFNLVELKLLGKI